MYPIFWPEITTYLSSAVYRNLWRRQTGSDRPGPAGGVAPAGDRGVNNLFPATAWRPTDGPGRGSLVLPPPASGQGQCPLHRQLLAGCLRQLPRLLPDSLLSDSFKCSCQLCCVQCSFQRPLDQQASVVNYLPTIWMP